MAETGDDAEFRDGDHLEVLVLPEEGKALLDAVLEQRLQVLLAAVGQVAR